ncbi:DUF3592 domain-containing protein [Kitasatospora sp. NPDC057223]|uniref:DUF3592 domain-containing protein n=1 Tax=Kitasatospora sp. NPDC057223 TaxID=3346055 RepID=UPI00363A42E1
MSESPSPTHSEAVETPLLADVVLRNGRHSARFSDGSVLIVQGRTTHRIPVAAIERAEPSGGDVLVVLTAVPGRTGEIFRIRGRSAGAAGAFVRTVSAALPVTDRAERRADGAALVQTTVRQRGRGPARALIGLFNSWVKVSCWLYLAGFVLLGVELDKAAHLIVSMFLWGFGLPFLAASVAVMIWTWRSLSRIWPLHRRGIRVVAEVTGHEDEHELSYPVYRFVDADGLLRTHTARDEAGYVADRSIEICYDPADPSTVSRHPSFGPRIFWTGAALLLVGLPVTLTGLGMTVLPFVLAFTR